MKRLHLSVIMPAYNEGLRIFRNVAETAEVLSGLDFELIVVNDGSSDDTASEAGRAAALMDNVRVISYQQNRGKGHAVLTGAQAARGELVAFIDADLDIHPRQLHTALDIYHLTAADVVIGSKWHPQSVVDFPLYRRVISFGYYVFIRLLFGLPVRDTQTGIKVYRRELIHRLAARVSSEGYAFDLEMLVLSHRWGCRIEAVPVTVTAMRRSSRIRMKDIVNVGLDTLRVFWRLATASEEASEPATASDEEVYTAEAGRS